MNTDILYKPQQLQDEISRLKDERETLRSCAEKTTSIISLAPGHGQGLNRTMEDILARVADLDAEIEAKTEELSSTVTYLLEQFDTVDNIIYRTILIHRFVLQETWQETAQQIGYCIRHCQRFLKKAVSALTQ